VNGFLLAFFRKSNEEKVLIVIKYREGHKCDYQWNVMAIIKWDGIKTEKGNQIYETMRRSLGVHGISSNRKCGGNKDKSCPCNGQNQTGGASFTFGCSVHKYYKCCKFGPGNPDRNIELNSKFKLTGKTKQEQKEIAKTIHNLADDIAPIFKAHAPDAYGNMTGMCLNLRGNIYKKIML
jgi:hypothetical protein